MNLRFSLTHAQKAELFSSQELAHDFAAEHFPDREDVQIGYSPKYNKYFIGTFHKDICTGILEKSNA